MMYAIKWTVKSTKCQGEFIFTCQGEFIFTTEKEAQDICDIYNSKFTYIFHEVIEEETPHRGD